MLTLGAGSVCDVCLEPFGRGNKQPCSVLCGHVFCIECVNRLRASNMNAAHPEIDYGAPCPLCRKHFDQRSIIKLHIDYDSGSSPRRATCLTAAETEAKRLKEAIADVANAGTTEHNLRQLISETTTFLSLHPRDQFSDLRVSHRMVAYLCEIKAKLRDQKVDYEKQITKLKEEKAELERKVEAVSAARKDEAESALAIEMSLREHCTRAHKAYEDMVGHVTEWSKLGEQLARLRSTETRIFDDPRVQRSDVATTPEYVDDTLSSYHDQRMRLSGAALTDSASFLVSPLPQFTGVFPTSAMNAFPLPDVESDSETQREEPRYDMPSRSLPDCNARGHPVSCPCVEVPRFPELPRSVQQGNRPTASRSRSATMILPHADGPNRSAPIPIPDPYHDNIPNGDNDYTSRRSSSRTRRHSNRSRPQSRGQGSNEASPQQSSPLHIPRSSARTHGRTSGTADEIMPSSSTAPVPTTPQPNSYNLKNHRLQDLLQDTPVGTSSSLPNMHIHSPSSSRRDSYNSREKDRSSLSYPTLHPPMLPQDREHRPAPSPEPAPSRVNPPAAYDPNAPLSSASSAAKALERARQEREQAEKAERRGKEKEKERERERERERYNGVREGDQYAENSDRHWRKVSNTSSTYSKSQWTDSAGAADRSAQSVSSSSRHPSSRDSGPLHPSTSDYGSRRSTTSSSHSSTRSAGAGSLRGPFSADKYPQQAIPVLSATRA
ncbi:putative ring finger domain containing protein [Lyophyllum shimeji]|uniref:Ring finger domain containing protein n=1 Tax=Lyophyllum shimeji TaxID=47721 RepID=A0A9P3PTA4_LYOSH|nr:putative ring finger domain containing protein [Lyophyllum shimeji]